MSVLVSQLTFFVEILWNLKSYLTLFDTDTGKMFQIITFRSIGEPTDQRLE